MDDLKLSYIHQSALDNIVDKLNEVFGQDRPKLIAMYGINDYLGIAIDWSSDGRIRFTMYDFLEDVLEEALFGFNGEDTTSATKFLF